MQEENKKVVNIKVYEEEKKDIIELYKLAVEMADKASQRRGVANNFYFTLISGLFTASLILHQSKAASFSAVIFLLTLGILICCVWSAQITSYQKLNSAKFKVINEIEKQLPVQIFTDEYKFYKKQKRRDFSDIEKQLPFVLGCVCFVGIVILLILRNIGVV